MLRNASTSPLGGSRAAIDQPAEVEGSIIAQDARPYSLLEFAQKFQRRRLGRTVIDDDEFNRRIIGLFRERSRGIA